MRNVWTITKREINLYFVSPIAYAITLAMLLVLGLIFYAQVSGSRYYGNPPDYIGWVLGPLTTLLLFLCPAVTMRLLADEQRTGTIELLLTAPVREWELVVGKWLAAFGYMVLLLLVTGLYVVILNHYTQPSLDLPAIGAAYLGIALMIAAMLAMGVFVSTWFSNQIAVFFATFALTLLFWLVAIPFQNQTGPVADVFNYLDFSNHLYRNFMTGVLDLSDATYFVSAVALFLFLATRAVESRRWR